jgi:hypothetical protein
MSPLLLSRAEAGARRASGGKAATRREAIRYLESGHARGKVVVTV